jgi:hypothetical protein
MLCPHIFSKEVGQIVEVQLGIHRRQLHGQKLQKKMYIKGKRLRWSSSGRSKTANDAVS